ncbi:MAG TPA: hypothetical protein VKA46_29595 [Gemmataceae bacterium]|nr:hypothetical protein [Gemmataceae bacterium]
MPTSNDNRAEVRERLNELRETCEALDELLGNGDRLPAFPLAKVTLAIDKMATTLGKHLATLGGSAGRR